MGTLQQEIIFFSNLYNPFQKAVAGTLDKEAKALRDRIAARSPVYTGRYKAAWRYTKSRSSQMIASSEIKNPSVQAESIELGVASKNMQHAWAISWGKSPVERGKGIIKSNSRIWSRKAVGGSMDKEFTPAYEKRLSQAIADAAISVF